MAKCGSDHSNEIKKDFKAMIVGMNGDDNYIDYRTPVKLKTVLFRVLGDSAYFEMNSEDGKNVVTSQWFYNHSVGDTVHFEWVRYDRFFTIDRKRSVDKYHISRDTLTREERLFGN